MPIKLSDCTCSCCGALYCVFCGSPRLKVIDKKKNMYSCQRCRGKFMVSGDLVVPIRKPKLKNKKIHQIMNNNTRKTTNK